MANSAGDVAKRMRAVGEAMQKAQKISVAKAALAAKEVHVAGMLKDAPGGRLRGVGKKGAKIGVNYKLQGGASDPSAIVEATGPWHIMNNPAKPHKETGKKGKKLMFAGIFRSGVNHPGHAGKFTWQKSEPVAMKAAVAELNKTAIKAIQQAFKG